MTATIRAHCPVCGEVTITELDMFVHLNTDDQNAWRFTSYSFCCPTCKLRSAKQCQPRTAELLLANGVKSRVWNFPLEVSEPKPTGAPFNTDDMLDFFLALREDDWIAEQMAVMAADLQSKGLL